MQEGTGITQRIAVKAIIVNDKNEVLILREADTYEEGTNHGRYHLPGGRINVGEPFLEGLRREVTEETGLVIDINQPVYAGEWFPVIKGTPNQIVAIYFRCMPLTHEISLSLEHDDYKWVDLSEISNYDIMAPEPEAIRTALS